MKTPSLAQVTQRHNFMFHGSVASISSRLTQLVHDSMIDNKDLKTHLHSAQVCVQKALKIIEAGGPEEMIVEIVAKLDKKGSEMAKCNHYIIGKPGADVSGGVYISKKMENPPDFIKIEIPQVKGE